MLYGAAEQYGLERSAIGDSEWPTKMYKFKAIIYFISTAY